MDMVKGIIDSHAHVCGKDLFPRWEQVIRDAKNVGVEKILIICTETEEAKRAVSIAEKDLMFDVACGFYPNDILKVTDKDWQELEKLVRHPAVKAVGEIGMDYFPYETVVPAGLQKEAFIRQMQLAEQVKKPIAVHMRLATEDTKTYMRQYLKTGGIMHCYSGGYTAMQDFLDMGMYISFSGNITFELDDLETQKAVKEVPLDRILVETDAPSLTPAPVQNRQNEPQYVRYVIDHICRLRGISPEELVKAVGENYRRLFQETEA